MTHQTRIGIEDRVKQFSQNFLTAQQEVQKRIIGQNRIVENVLISLFADGHVLLEGVPGLGKTKLVQTLSQILGLSFKRIQFTPDMMPSDITGTMLLVEDSKPERNVQQDPDSVASVPNLSRNRFQFQRGPIFSQIVLADEINRATPRTQSALLEAMQERTVSISTVSHPLACPFCVLATQNPLDMDGTYKLPEAQLDRFLFKLLIDFPDGSELLQIMHQTTATQEADLHQILSADQILAMQQLVRQVQVSDPVAKHIIRIVQATHPNRLGSHDLANQYVELGVSVRGMQSITLAAKVHALLGSRLNIDFEDVGQVVLPALRHRLLLNFEAQGENITTDTIIQEILASKDIER